MADKLKRFDYRRIAHSLTRVGRSRSCGSRAIEVAISAVLQTYPPHRFGVVSPGLSGTTHAPSLQDFIHPRGHKMSALSGS